MKFMASFILFVFGFFAFPILLIPVFGANENSRIESDRELLLDAICLVESNGNKDAVGDNGKSRGAYQIQEAYWNDSRYPEPYLPNVWDKEKSRKVVRQYCSRYAGKNASNKVWARTHNGGPKGASKKATLKYWNKVKAKMEDLLKK